MEIYTPKWHNEHILNDPKIARQVLRLENESKGESTQVTIHTLPCAICMALLAEVVYPKSIVGGSILKMTEVVDGPTTAPAKA